MKKKESLLELPISVSRLLDSLSLEAAITISDNTSLGLLEMLQWLTDGAVSREQFSQLYSAWSEAKPITDVLVTHQQQAFDKVKLVDSLPSHLISEEKLRGLVEVLQQEYTSQLLGQHYSESLTSRLPVIRNIFELLDQENVGHVRRSELFLLLEALTQIGIVKLNSSNMEHAIMDRLQTLQKQLSGIDGIVSMRNFTNGLINKQLTTAQLSEMLKYLMNTTNKTKGRKNIVENALARWRNTPRFVKRKIDKYRRLFEEHDYLFLNGNLDVYQIEARLEVIYGKSFLMMCDIDFVVIREFCDILKKELAERLKNFSTFSNKKSSLSTKKTEVQTPKSSNATKHTLSSTKHPSKLKSPKSPKFQTTPKKLPNTLTITPKRYQPEVLRSVRQTISTFSKKSSREQDNPLQSIRSPCKIKTMVEDELVGPANFFKNRRIESFEVVMKRLRSKRLI